MMKFDDLDKKMRVFETINDVYSLPCVYMVARIDGRSFTRLTKETHKFSAPFDETFRDYMIETVKHLMACGFTVLYGYTQSDEISLLFSLEEDAFSRKHRKYNSILASEAAAKFTFILGAPAAFDCRICELPTPELVADYFRWRSEDAHRNALNAHCYWRLRGDGLSQQEATSTLEGMSVADKNELLFGYGVNFNDLPAWQKRGVGLYWRYEPKGGVNPVTGAKTTTQRRRIYVDMELPMKEMYRDFILNFLNDPSSEVPKY
ncbi:guanylyltransferase [Alphaproteobacteria bacterium]|nr:guanylyltransferase [Alphaproteobacteria bacterium]